MATASISTTQEPPPYGAAGIVTAAILGLYVLTIAPTTQFWDTSEYIAAAKVLGIPHPPGNPLFTLVAHVWGAIPMVPHYALRINLFAAVTSAVSSGLLFLVAERFLRPVIAPRLPRLLTAAAGILVGATSFTVWNQATVNEKVYTISLISIALVLWLAVRWADEAAGSRRDRHLVLIGYILALTSTNHLMGVLVAPAVLVLVLYVDPAVLLRWRVWAAVLVVAAVGLSVNGFLPIRAAHFPPINEGEPTTWEAFMAVLNREQYQKPPLSYRQADIIAQYGNYWQYFKWQFAKDWPPLMRPLAAFFGILGLVGAWRHWKAERRSAMAMIALMGTLVVLLVFYLNFKYGFSYDPSRNLDTEVRERDYFFVASFLCFGVWVAMGLATLLESTAGFFAERAPEPRRWYLAMPVLLIAFIPLAGNRLSASRAGETMARDFAVDLLESVEPYSILLTAGDNDTFPLWYAQEVEGVRRDVLLVNQSLAGTDWHLKQILRRPIEPFDTARAVAPYRGMNPPMPSGPVVNLTEEQLLMLPPFSRLDKRQYFNVGKLVAAIEPQDLDRADFVALQLILDNLGKRPIYFSRTSANWPDRLGLTGYMLGQGFVRKVMPEPIQPSDTTKFVRILGWVDLARTRDLLFDVYHGATAARERPRGWVDVPSESILSLYYMTYGTYAEIMRGAADETGTTPAPLDSATIRELDRATSIANGVARQLSFGREGAP